MFIIESDSHHYHPYVKCFVYQKPDMGFNSIRVDVFF